LAAFLIYFISFAVLWAH